jgi:hypothetical protein
MSDDYALDGLLVFQTLRHLACAANTLVAAINFKRAPIFLSRGSDRISLALPFKANGIKFSVDEGEALECYCLGYCRQTQAPPPIALSLPTSFA